MISKIMDLGILQEFSLAMICGVIIILEIIDSDLPMLQVI